MNIVRLPEPVPEGWVKSTLFADTWSRPYGPPEDVPTRVGEARGCLTVERGSEGGYYVGIGFEAMGLRWRHPTLREACAAAERAFCGCYVGAVVKWESAP